jgi:hypothetical protein
MLETTKINSKFTCFSNVMIEKCKTKLQIQKSLGISKILWLLLIKEQDSEENIYKALFEILNDHEATISFGSLYFHSMKSELTKVEVRQLKNHYTNPVHFQELSDWMNESYENPLH